MSIIAILALLAIAAVGLWVTVPWFDDNRLAISMLFLMVAIVFSALPVSTYARIAAFFAG